MLGAASLRPIRSRPPPSSKRLGIPRRLVTLIEGESLVNDATALVAYRVAVGAVVTGTFSARDLGQGFIVAVAGGLAVGLVVGYLVRMVRRRLDNRPQRSRSRS